MTYFMGENKKEKTLSEKRKTNVVWKPYKEFGFYWETDVKEAIEKLKEELRLYGMHIIVREEIIDKIFGSFDTKEARDET